MASKVSWRWTLVFPQIVTTFYIVWNANDSSSLWYDVPWLIILSIMLFIVLPSSKMAAGTRARLGMIDWVGVAVSVAAIVLLLVSPPIFKMLFSLADLSRSGAIISRWLGFRVEQLPRHRYARDWSSYFCSFPGCGVESG